VIRAPKAGGPVFDTTPNMLTINVVPAGGNIPPIVATNTGSHVTQGLTDVITSAELRVTDVDNTPSQVRYTIISLPRPTRLPAPGPVWMRGMEYRKSVSAGTTTSDDPGVNDDSRSSVTNGDKEGAINSPPVNTIPGEQTVIRGSSVGLSGISVADGDGDLATVQLHVINGTITVMVADEAAIVSGANGSKMLTLSGSQDDVNATLATLTYHAPEHYTGPDALTVISTDRKRLSDTSTVVITVVPDGNEAIHNSGISEQAGSGVDDRPEDVEEHEPEANLYEGGVSPLGVSLSAGFTAVAARLIVRARRRTRKEHDNL